jgi:hypothetical protein
MSIIKNQKKGVLNEKMYKMGVLNEKRCNTLNKLSMEPNKDPSYTEKGIIHTTTVGAINIVRGIASGFANMFGSKGFDNTIYDQKREEALSNLQKSLKQNQKICNLKIEIDSGPEVFFIHTYGSLYEKP